MRKDLGLIYQLFVVPSLGMRRASEGRRLPLACLVVVLAVLSNQIGWLLMMPANPYRAKIFFGIYLFTDLILAFGSLFLLTSIFHLVAETSGGRGKGSSLYTVLSLALIPFWMITPSALILKSLGKGGFPLFPALWLITLGWTVALFVIGIREVYHLSWGKTAAIFILPLTGISLALFILFWLLLISLFLSAIYIFKFFPLAMDYM